MSDGYDADMINFIDQVSERYITTIREDRAQSDQLQIRNMNVALKDWSEKILATSKEMIDAMQQQTVNKHGTPNGFEGTIADIKDRQAKMITAMQESYNRQMEIMRAAISEERKEAALAQSVCNVLILFSCFNL
jgi:hypothetical protein